MGDCAKVSIKVSWCVRERMDHMEHTDHMQHLEHMEQMDRTGLARIAEC